MRSIGGLRLCLVTIAAVVAVAAARQSAVPIGVVLPHLIAGDLPEIPLFAQKAGIYDDVVATVTTDGSRITKAVFSQGTAVYRPGVERSLGTWRFAPHAATTFDVAFHFAKGEARCVPQNDVISLRLPIDLRIVTTGQLICDGTVLEHTGAEATLTLAQPAGRVVDESAGTPIAHATVTLRGDNEKETPRTQFTKADGTFDFGVVLDGRFELAVVHGYRTTIWPVRISEQTPRLVRAELKVLGDPGDVPPIATAQIATIPTYPVSAREEGLDGVVVLRVTSPFGKDAKVVALSGPRILADSAIEHLRTWQLRINDTEPSFDVVYRYSLLPGDCSGDDGPVVELKPPAHVSISMKRRVSCH